MVDKLDTLVSSGHSWKRAFRWEVLNPSLSSFTLELELLLANNFSML